MPPQRPLPAPRRVAAAGQSAARPTRLSAVPAIQTEPPSADGAVPALVGRGGAQAVIAGALDAARKGTTTIVRVGGEPGVGKSAMLEWASARAADFEVLRATGLEGESDLSFSCLTTLLRPLVGDVARLMRPRARALAAAMAIEDAPTEALAVCSATLDLLGYAAERRPVLLLLDDAQWFDHASAQAIRFAMARLSADGVAFLVAVRSAETSDFDELPMLALDLDPLGAADIAELLAEGESGASPRTVGHGVADACRELTGGNPLALQELRAHLGDEQVAGREPLPSMVVLSADARRRFELAVMQLTAEGRRLLLLVAFDDTLREDIVLLALAHAGLAEHGLDALERARILDVGPGIRFRHPLLRTVAIAGATRREAQDAHRALAYATGAATVDEGASPSSLGWALQQSHAWHFAEMAAGVRPDAAEALAVVATNALRRGAPVAAARAWKRATDLAAADRRALYLTEGAEAFARASMHASAADLFARALTEPLTGEVRSRAMFGHVDTLLWQDTRRAALIATKEASMLDVEAPRDASRLFIVGATAWSLSGNLVEATRTARSALSSVQRADPALWGTPGDDAKAMESAMIEAIGATIEVYAGGEASFGPLLDGIDAFVVGVDLGEADEGLLIALQHLAIAQIVRERWDVADHTLSGIRRGARRLGVEGMDAFGAALAGELGWRRGRWAESLAGLNIAEGDRTVRVDRPLTFGHAVAARIRAAQGSEEAAADAAAVVTCAESMGMVLLELWARHSLGVAAIARGDWESAISALRPARVLSRGGAAGEAGLVWWQGDLLDALVQCRRVGDATLLVEELEAQAGSTGRGWAHHIAARGRAMVLEAGPERNALFAAAVDHAKLLGAVFEEARTQLAWGEAALSSGETPAAEAALAKARDLFSHLGAGPFAVRAETQLGVLGTPTVVRVSSPVAALLRSLTQAELRVAVAVGHGMSNQEAAENLFLSVRTVGWHLGSVYRKLGVRSRSELAAALNRERNTESR